MILVNFSHPLSADQLKQLQALLGASIDRVVEVHSQIEPDRPLALCNTTQQRE
ncbi:CRISPR-associated protein Csx15 [Thermanaerothrix sp. 4228-RoL]|uniref:CRISPR-associated protein Csx15 n=1 Tax=Thermanaerothrix solaris TaxID=3058434 RepID=A0ABU3NNR8_9CHLR|nr:CRISPR-associated protein Csx15 [Thermanaerothrix sp. 4228-RoL]MDT8897617.1 CRISPR-associated protein Csx15 [Thermanaerothrix sp. 4228-RoL]